MRVYITERCNASCPNCFNASSRQNTEMSIDTFSLLCQYLSENGISILKVMGGEPSIHTEFKKIIEIAQSYFSNVVIFTNGLDKQIQSVKLRNSDSIVYNFTFNKSLSAEKLLLQQDGKRTFEIQVTNITNENELIDRIVYFSRLSENKIRISLTLDCTSNIFKTKEIVVKKLQVIEKRLFEENIHFSYDHKMPLCFLYKTGLHPNNSSLCEVETSAVIDSNLNLRFCLQNPEKLVSLYQNGHFVPWSILLNHLYKKFYELRTTALGKICLDCVFFNKKCNGGCWIPKSNITKDDILNNTDFPLR